jgi:hypothetical protein
MSLSPQNNKYKALPRPFFFFFARSSLKCLWQHNYSRKSRDDLVRAASVGKVEIARVLGLI